MARWMDGQQEYINALQKDLDSARRAKRILTEIWEMVEADSVWNEGQQIFKVRLNGRYGHAWGEHENEHTAWNIAWKALCDQGVLKAKGLLNIVQKMDEKESE